MKIIPLSEGAFTIDKTKVFVPFNIDTEELNTRPVGSLLVEIQPFVIITDKDVILLDTGLGHNEGPGRFISFPYATWYIQKREFDYAMEAGTASYITEDFELLRDFSKVVWLTEDEGLIDNYIRYQLTGAHSKFHQVFWIEENGQTAFFGGDVAPQLQQMKNRFIAKYDFDGKKCMELRGQWWQQGQEEKWIFLFYHDIKSPVWPDEKIS